MRSWPVLLLASALAPSPAPAPGAATAGDKVTIFRCVDARGVVSLQDKPCAKGSEGTSREMLRPKDAPPRPHVAEREPEPEPLPPEVEYVPLRLPPPPMFVCTSYDGVVRESEVYDPNPRCEPLVLYFPEPQRLPRSYQRSCQWVRDSCVRVSDHEACTRWKARRKVAASNALHSDAKSQPYNDSELARITDILRQHCY
jgi:hypothetical protein